MSRLPTVDNCPKCGPREYDPRKVSVFQRIGPMPPQDKWTKPSRKENFEGGEDKYHQPRWCPNGFSHSKKHRVQRLCNLEEAEAQYLEMLRKRSRTLGKEVAPSEERVAPQANKSRWDSIDRDKHSIHSPFRILCTRQQGVTSSSA
jgi:hypothetical protein